MTTASSPGPDGPDSPAAAAQVSFADVTAAREVLAGVIRPTPLLRSRAMSELIGGPVCIKCENLQRTGSFKVRGAYLRIASMTPRQRARGVIAASAGNHAQGVALAASMLGTQATVVMPEGAPLPKIAATRSYGAQVVLHGMAVEDALARARELADETGAIFIHPFEHPDVIAGQGTVGLEIAEQCPDVATVMVPVGGGGLAAGIATAISGTRPAARVIGVQAEAAAPFAASLAAGQPVTVSCGRTMADGIAVARPGDLTFRLISQRATGVLTVSEENLSRALLLCLERAKQLVEPAGAAGVAALIEHPGAVEPPAVVVLSGGNIDPLLLAKVLRHGLAAAGRYLSLRCRLPDRPGALATLLTEVAAYGGNVIDVVHERAAADLRVDEAEVTLQVEARGPEHCEEVVAQLRKAGYEIC
ncbi:MAG: threonine ammonia-lyase [Streptosporangiaceae bacterium]